MFFNIFFKKNKDKRKSKKEKARYIKICPRCGSINVKVGNQGGSAGIVFGAPTMYRCLSCGYVNYAFPEVNTNELKNQTKRQKKG